MSGYQEYELRTFRVHQAHDDYFDVESPKGEILTLPKDETTAELSIGDRVVGVVFEDTGFKRVSCSAPEAIEALLAGFIPEIRSGDIVILDAQRVAGERTKVVVAATRSVNEDGQPFDVERTCLGFGSGRIVAINSFVAPETVQIVVWNDDPAQFVKNALRPAEVMEVTFDDLGAVASVGPHQSGLAVGMNGNNARLASALLRRQLPPGGRVRVEEHSAR